MSGAILYPPTRGDCDIGILFIEVSGCLPMCGHGAIGAATMALENGLVAPRKEGWLAFDAPAGRLRAGDDFVHESIIGSLFEGRIEGAAKVGAYAAIRPSVAGWARMQGYNTIFVDLSDPFAHGFQLDGVAKPQH